MKQKSRFEYVSGAENLDAVRALRERRFDKLHCASVIAKDPSAGFARNPA